MATNAELQANIDATTPKMTAAKTDYDTKYKVFSDNLSALSSNGGIPGYSGTINYKANDWVFKGFRLVANCDPSVPACSSLVKAFNSYAQACIDAWNLYDGYKTQIKDWQGQLDNSPETQAANTAAPALVKKATTKWLFFGLILLVIAGVALLLIFRHGIKIKFVVLSSLGAAIATYFIFFGLKNPTQ